jgi:metal-responsive CopG/Arc/MetJ family transcriptional regulator
MYEGPVAMMQRTQIYLDAKLNAELEREARKRGVSKAALIRLAARDLLQRDGQDGDEDILGIVGLGTGAPGRTSEEHDNVLADQSVPPAGS